MQEQSCFIFSLTLVISMLHKRKVKCNLMHQINKRHIVHPNFFPLCKFLPQNRLHFYAYMMQQADEITIIIVEQTYACNKNCKHACSLQRAIVLFLPVIYILNYELLMKTTVTMTSVCTSLFISGYKDQVYRKGDKLVVVHSHELHPPALPRKYSIICCITFSLA